MGKRNYISSYDADAPTPEVGSQWRWYSGKTQRPLGVPDGEWKAQKVYEPVVVREVKWNGEEWWVRTEGDRFGLRWNDLSVFWEQVKPA